MSEPSAKTGVTKRLVLIWAIGVAIWLAALAGAFLIDEWGYRVASRNVAAATGYRADRFGLAGGGGSSLLLQLLRLFKEMGQFFFILVISVTMIVLNRRRVRQVIILWACIALAAVIGQGLMRPGIAKLRPDARLNEAEEIAHVLQTWPDDPWLLRQFDHAQRIRTPKPPIRNVGKPLFRRPFSGTSSLTFPSGHTALAFAAFAALAAFFPKGRWWFLILASGVGLSRVLMGEHFLSDVIAGAGMGYACAAGLLAIPCIRSFHGESERMLCKQGR